MSLVDGTTEVMDCGIHNFQTKDLNKWEKHLKESGHYDVGHILCGECGKEFRFTEKAKVKSYSVRDRRVVHPECL